jgi:hypothetical protein
VLNQPSKADASNLTIPPSDGEAIDPTGANYFGDLTQRQKGLFWAIALSLALFRALDTRFQVSGDGISYIEMGDAYFRRDWKMAVNAYWSPLYSWLIVLPKHLFGLSLAQESTSVHLVNFLIFAFVLFSFEFLLSSLIAGISTDNQVQSRRLQPWALRLIGYSLFLYSTMYWLSTDVITPDLCVEGLVFLAVGILLRIRFQGAGWSNFALLGLVLGIGYLTKVVFFPLAFVFLFVSFFATPNFRQWLPKVSVAFLIFLIVATPYILALSHAKGRFTYGDTGKLAYATYVNNAPLGVHWQGKGGLFGAPLHPTRKILDNPSMYEFSEPIGGSYPAWYDPSYWYDGVVPKFFLSREIYKVHMHLHFFAELFAEQGEFIAVFLALFLIAPVSKTFLMRWSREAFLWVPALVAFGAYSLIHIETRFLPAFLVIFWLSLFAALTIPDSAAARKIVWCVTIAVALTVGIRVLRSAVVEAGHVTGPRLNIYANVAQQLHELGLRPGDKVGSIGFGFDGHWAHLAGVTIVAEIPESDAGAFWIADPETKAKVFELFAKYGAKAVVCNRIQAHTIPSDWIRITGWTPDGRATYYVHPIGVVPPQ